MYFQTSIQQVLASACVNYTEGPWRVQLTGGWADWNVSGNWQGTNIDTTAMDPFFWGWQQQLDIKASYEVWGGLAVGAGYSGQALRHYRGDDKFTYLQYRTQAYELFARYAFLRVAGIELAASAAYAPYASMEWFQDTNLPDWYPAIQQFDTAGKGTRWHAALQGSYRHPWGWGVDLIYDAGFSRFPEPRDQQEVSLRFGRLAGYLIFPF
jgi:hypothetical protein